MNSNSKATSRQSKNSRIQAGQTSLVPAAAKATESNVQQRATRFDSIVERLQRSQVEHDDLFEFLGYCKGRRWAESMATMPEVGRLKQAVGPWSIDWYACMTDSGNADAVQFLFIIRLDFDGDYTAVSEFWETVTGDREMPESAYVQAFVQGALEIWEEFADQDQTDN